MATCTTEQSALCLHVLQVAFKGYEEARVALTCLLFTVPCCVIIGVEYGVFMDGKLKTVRHECGCWLILPTHGTMQAPGCIVLANVALAFSASHFVAC